MLIKKFYRFTRTLNWNNEQTNIIEKVEKGEGILRVFVQIKLQ